MAESQIEIKGGAGEFEAAVIAVVLDRIAQEEAAARSGKRARLGDLPAWVRAIQPERNRFPGDFVYPD
ncbi:MAG TPA: hypothetical protein VFS66_05315 [Acidimicrobiia bacterium]|nr:hypothetical protein [Acidimicrobiia bacterium]